MVLGLYYITKAKRSEKDDPVTRGRHDLLFAEEVTIAYNEKACRPSCRYQGKDSQDWEPRMVKQKLIETTVGRVIFNESVPEEIGFINELSDQEILRDIIGRVLKVTGTAKTAKFLDDIKNLGYGMAFKGGLSFNLDDVIIPTEKETFVTDGYSQVDEVSGQLQHGCDHQQ
jgi:DNA-directed RNA polymerase subunit beta'